MLFFELIQPQTYMSPLVVLAALKLRKFGESRSGNAENRPRCTVVISVSDRMYGDVGSGTAVQPRVEAAIKADTMRAKASRQLMVQAVSYGKQGI